MSAAAVLLPYQRDWVRDPAPFKVCEKGRRIGLSWAEAYDAVMHGAAAERGRGDYYYQSYSAENAKEFITDCHDWAERLDKGASEIGEEVLGVDSEGLRTTALTVRLASGNVIHALTSAPRQFRSRGRPGAVACIDEAAFVDDLTAVLKAVMAFLMWGGRVRVISTHNGESNDFAQLCGDLREGERPGSLHTVPFAKALADGLYRRICRVAGDRWTKAGERRWASELRAGYGPDAAEELDCRPSKGGGAWLDWGLIRACEHPDAGDPSRYGGGPCWAGVDVAVRRHLFVASVFEEVGDVLWLREQVARAGVTFAEQTDVMAGMWGRYRMVRAAVDQTGMGEKVVEDWRRQFGRSRVEGVLFTAPSRLALATSLRERVEDRRIRLPVSRLVRDDLHSIKAVRSAAGGAPRLLFDGSAGADGHGDRFWSCALAAEAAAARRPVYEYRRINDRDPSRLPARRLGGRGPVRWRTQPGALA